ncbi:NAD-dependent epimerase/dehydratase family protein [Azospirillum argentinense]
MSAKSEDSMTNAEFPRLAIIGCGSIVSHHLLPALLRLGWRPSVLVDPTPGRLEAVQAMLGRSRAPVAVADWREAADQFDAALVAAPPMVHAPVGQSLLEAGKHVFMEKPLAVTLADAERMVQTAEERRRVLAVGLMRRYVNGVRWLKALIDTGQLGRVLRFEAREGFVYNWGISSPAMLRRDGAGGGVLLDTGSHTLDLLLWWFGEAAEVDYSDDSHGGLESDCRLSLTMASGATGTLELSRTRALRNTIRVHGTKGSVEVHLYENQIASDVPQILDFVHDGFSANHIPPQIFGDLFQAELKDFADAIRDGRPAAVGGRDALPSTALIERCYASRKPLALPWVDGPAPATATRTDGPRTDGPTVVVTGAAGFIGGRLVERLCLEHGAKVRCIVRDIAQAVRLARFPVEIVRADLLDREAIGKAVAGADWVFHCAYDVRSRRQNIDGMNALIDASLANGVESFVHLSTFSVYEPLPDGPLSEETRDGDRAWSYVQNKLDLEKMVLDAAHKRGLPGVVLQPSIVYGPFCKPWTNAPAEMLLSGTVVLPQEGGLCNAVYIDDLVDAMIAATRSPQAIGERFVISGPDAPPWAAVFGRFQEALGVDSLRFQPAAVIRKEMKSLRRDIAMVLQDPKKIIQIIVRWRPARRVLQGGFDSLPPRLRHLVMVHYFLKKKVSRNQLWLPDAQKLALYQAKALIDLTKARRLLGYEPRFTFEDGMALTADYLRWAYRDVPRTAPAAPAARPANEDRQPAPLPAPTETTRVGSA